MRRGTTKRGRAGREGVGVEGEGEAGGGFSFCTLLAIKGNHLPCTIRWIHAHPVLKH